MINTVVDGSNLLQTRLDCHGCDAWTAIQTTLDVDRGFALATGPLGWTVADLFATSNSADLYENQNHNIAEALNFIRKRYDPKYAMLSPIWNLGEPLKLSHVDLPRPRKFKRAGQVYSAT